MEFKEGFIKVDGGKVYYAAYGKPGKTPLLVLQGGPGCAHGYLIPLKALANERPVIFYDQLGTGKSDHPTDKSLWTIERYVKELEQVRASLKLERVVLYGHSWGTMLATDYLLTRPNGIESVILSGACLSAERWKKDTLDLRNQLPKNILAIYDKNEKAGTTDSKEYQEAFAEFIKTFVCRINPMPPIVEQTFANWNQDIYKTMWGPSEWYVVGNLKNYERVDRLHEITEPTLLLGGQYDQARPDTLKLYQSKFPHAEVRVFKNSSHLGMWEEENLYVDTMREYLDRKGL